MISSFVILAFFGVVVGWIYKGLVGSAGPRTSVCIAYAILGSLIGGLIFLFTGLGGELAIGLVSSIIVLISADVLSRELSHD